MSRPSVAASASVQLALDHFRDPVAEQANTGEQQHEEQGSAQAVRPAPRLVDLDDQAQEATHQPTGAPMRFSRIGVAQQGAPADEAAGQRRMDKIEDRSIQRQRRQTEPELPAAFKSSGANFSNY